MPAAQQYFSALRATRRRCGGALAGVACAGIGGGGGGGGGAAGGPPRLSLPAFLALFLTAVVLVWATSAARSAAAWEDEPPPPRFVPALAYPAMAGRGPSLLASVRSLDVRVRRLYIFDNSDGSPDVACAVEEVRWLAARGAVPVDNVTVLGPPAAPRAAGAGRFMGVAETWNALLRRALVDDGAPWALLLNDDVAFPPGGLAAGAAAVWRRHHSHAAVFVDSELPGNTRGHMFAAWAATRLGLGAVGELDENFYPAYYEDCDWFLRLRLAGVRWHVERGWRIVHPVAPWDAARHGGGGPYAGCMARAAGADAAVERRRREGKALVARVVNGTVPNGNRAYYRRKWGDEECGRFAWRYPFRDVQRPLSAWTLDAARRRNILDGIP